MIPKLSTRIRWFWRKNSPDFWALVHRRMPRFIYTKQAEPLQGEVPVFTFHYVEPVSFEAQLHFLKDNGYTTLSGREFEGFLAGEIEVPEKSVLLTFDDGSASLFSVAYPLLKKYNFRAVSFLIPGLIPESAPESPTYDDFISGHANADDLLRRERGEFPLCSWEEIELMYKSGVIEFQSHSLYHHLINVDSEVIDFIHPDYNYYYFGRINIPVYRVNGVPDYAREMPLGTPIFRAEPRYGSWPEFLDNEVVRKACTDYVARNGGETFFNRKNWRNELFRVYRSAAKEAGDGELQTPEQQEKDIFVDMVESKRRIEEKLPGHTVTQLCYPWFIGSERAVRVSKKAGYKVNYWGLVKGRATNRPGSDPYFCSRLEDRFLFRLPGKGRLSLREVLWRKFLRYGKRRDPILYQQKSHAEKIQEFSF